MLSELIFDFVKYPNQKTHECESEGFQVLYNYYSNFFCGVVRFKNGVSKKSLKLYFQNGIWPGIFGETKIWKGQTPKNKP